MSSTALDTTITLRVLLFASYADRFGRDTIALDVAPGTTVGQALALIRALPGGDLLPPRPLCALNLAHVGPDAPIQAGDELAILPPLAGG